PDLLGDGREAAASIGQVGLEFLRVHAATPVSAARRCATCFSITRVRYGPTFWSASAASFLTSSATSVGGRKDSNALDIPGTSLDMLPGKRRSAAKRSNAPNEAQGNSALAIGRRPLPPHPAALDPRNRLRIIDQKYSNSQRAHDCLTRHHAEPFHRLGPKQL